MIDRIEGLKFNEESHTYTDEIYGTVLTPVSKTISKFKTPFEERKMAGYVAKSRGVSVIEVLSEWEKKRRRSTEYGTLLHWTMEQGLLGNEVDYEAIIGRLGMIKGDGFMASPTDLVSSIDELRKSIDHYDYGIPELRIFDPDSGICGTMDLALVRKSGLVDIVDFKTNIENGIQFDSIKWEEGKVKKDYKRKMTGPLAHLEDCNYVHYCLQLSMYGYMIEKWFKAEIGKLTIKYIDNDMVWHDYPVPYMRSDVINVINHLKNGIY